MTLPAIQDEKIACEVSEFLDSREEMPSTSHKPANNYAAFLKRDQRIIKRRERVHTHFPQINILRPSIASRRLYSAKLPILRGTLAS
jgi:hypothetical protein